MSFANKVAPGFEPRTAGWEALILSLCYCPLTFLKTYRLSAVAGEGTSAGLIEKGDCRMADVT